MATPKKSASGKPGRKTTARKGGTPKGRTAKSKPIVPAGYASHRDDMAAASRARSVKGREIGPIPDIEDPDRRERCMSSLRLFCDTYNPAAFQLGWSEAGERSIRRMEEAIDLGALFAFAEARGSGKTTR